MTAQSNSDRKIKMQFDLARKEAMLRRRREQLARVPDDPIVMRARVNRRRTLAGMKPLKPSRSRYSPSDLVAIRARKTNFLGEPQR